LDQASRIAVIDEILDSIAAVDRSKEQRKDSFVAVRMGRVKPFKPSTRGQLVEPASAWEKT